MPRVTVITPNYNHAPYLPQRLDSVLEQTFRDFELIVLDDASTDGSRAVIEAYAARAPGVRTIFNARNSGSTFKQWNLGLSCAKGEYIWFAESDDYADPALLETLVDRLDRHPNVGLAMCQSWMIDQDGKVLQSYTDVLEHCYPLSTRWREDFVAPGREYCVKYMYRSNTIPNASAVLLRRDLLEWVGGRPATCSVVAI
jgi:glycosyltransferase involved in cell wall biosynthesis